MKGTRIHAAMVVSAVTAGLFTVGGSIGAVAAPGPSIIHATMVAATHSASADGVVLTYAAPITRAAQKKGPFPFVVEGYTITSIGAAAHSTTLLVSLQRQSVSDLTATPFVTYSVPSSNPVLGHTGAKSPDQFFLGTTAVAPASAIYVSLSGKNSNPGTRVAPKATIPAALAVAASRSPRPQVYVSAGTYATSGGLTLVSGVSIDGGYVPGSWARSSSAKTIIQGSPQAVSANGVTGVAFQLLTLSAQRASSGDLSVYGVRAVTSHLVFDDVTINAADAAAGTNGLDGVAGDGELVLQERQRLAAGHAELPFDEVLPGDHLGDRMLDLQAGVHLHEVEFVTLDDEFDGAGPHVSDGAGGGAPGFTHGAAAFG